MLRARIILRLQCGVYPVLIRRCLSLKRVSEFPVALKFDPFKAKLWKDG